MNIEEASSKVRTILIVSTIINIGLIILKELLAEEELCYEERARNNFILIASIIVLKKLQDELLVIAQREQQAREAEEIERQLEQQFQEIDFQILHVQTVPYRGRSEI